MRTQRTDPIRKNLWTGYLEPCTAEEARAVHAARCRAAEIMTRYRRMTISGQWGAEEANYLHGQMVGASDVLQAMGFVLDSLDIIRGSSIMARWAVGRVHRCPLCGGARSYKERVHGECADRENATS